MNIPLPLGSSSQTPALPGFGVYGCLKRCKSAGFDQSIKNKRFDRSEPNTPVLTLQLFSTNYVAATVQPFYIPKYPFERVQMTGWAAARPLLRTASMASFERVQMTLSKRMNHYPTALALSPYGPASDSYHLGTSANGGKYVAQ
jgi:hypothetical protein